MLLILRQMLDAIKQKHAGSRYGLLVREALASHCAHYAVAVKEEIAVVYVGLPWFTGRRVEYRWPMPPLRSYLMQSTVRLVW